MRKQKIAIARHRMALKAERVSRNQRNHVIKSPIKLELNALQRMGIRPKNAKQEQ